MAAPGRVTRRGAKSPAIGYPTWLAQPAALTPNSRLLDCPPHNIGMPETLAIAKDYDHVIINTSTPSLKNDCKVAEAIKAQKPPPKIGFIGAHTMVLPAETLNSLAALTGWAQGIRFHLQGSRPKGEFDIAGFPTRTRTA